MARIKATHRFARISATKVRPFADMIRGMTVEQAELALQFVPNRGAKFLKEVLKTCAANAADRGARNVEGLKVVEAHADGGPMFKRIVPHARGMGFVIRKRFSHICVTIEAPETTA